MLLSIRIGKPVHFKREHKASGGSVFRTACGVSVNDGVLAAWDIRHVECYRCKRTRYYRDRIEKERG
jgi:hypothetical protein